MLDMNAFEESLSSEETVYQLGLDSCDSVLFDVCRFPARDVSDSGGIHTVLTSIAGKVLLACLEIRTN